MLEPELADLTTAAVYLVVHRVVRPGFFVLGSLVIGGIRWTRRRRTVQTTPPREIAG